MNSYLLDELLQHEYTDQDALLLDNLGDAMISNELYCSGASWEFRYFSQFLKPGLGEFRTRGVAHLHFHWPTVTKCAQIL
ncbi:hypothetical protein PF005_g28609 [Phytophthora fragariae]|uniref:Uncharacterized protein n=1 Tax=Phytophthora fragariae TaxID=53985 RepID=A0A6A3W499_9STRA|nr:hypothetical protein PF003_g17804 [Phytophthora fragariae]KAE8921003.1 hypothetical protein PF009_g28710 [Phytophthora fragariae]KAE8968468.1 hypothetical protein PF011_g27170 [Phytophthora fragariae]KAE9063057.1 hypothetical protein PF007_g29685 [Phytophthora fragariae]KAE9067254.1 hypothetical protein PF010_g27535 [Phytophthora fragariae]